MTRYAKTGVALPEDLLHELDEVLRSLGVTSRSQGIRMAIRNFIALNTWRVSRGVNVAGVILVHYNHEKHDVDEILTDIQHEHLDIIQSALHVHLSKEECLQIIAVKGKVEDIRMLTEKLGGVKGVLNIIPLIIQYLTSNREKARS